MIEVRRATPDQLNTCLAIRHEVFVLGQGVPPEIEVDGYDPRCVHFLAWEGQETIGTARLRILRDGAAKAERVAVRPGYQGKGVGGKLMGAIEQEAARRGHTELLVNAQVHVLPFYELMGYIVEGQPFTEASIPHRHMRKQLTPEDASKTT